VARALRSAYFQFTGEPMKAKVTKSVGNAAHFVRIAGIPAVYHGANYASAHSDNEQATVAELTRLAGVYALATAYFLEPEDCPCPPGLVD
jgi:acetylornithine deacetylase/succinyl-diaminopimelate desuccinylase-like protein